MSDTPIRATYRLCIERKTGGLTIRPFPAGEEPCEIHGRQGTLAQVIVVRGLKTTGAVTVCSECLAEFGPIVERVMRDPHGQGLITHPETMRR